MLSSTTLARSLRHSQALRASSSRFKSTAAVPNDLNADLPTQQHPTLKNIPSLPIVGSMISSYSGIPNFDPSEAMDTWPELTRRFGDFYSIGIPSIGAGSHGTVHILQDPKEMMKVLRSEGKFPTSIVTNQWPFVRYMAENPDPAAHKVGGILATGPEWRLIRDFMQKDILSPSSAKRYIPNIAKSCKYISKGIESRSDDILAFLNEASFDMFSTVLMGQFPHLTDPDTPTEQEDVLFCRSVATALQTNGEMTQSIGESIIGKTFGIKTKKYQRFETSWDTAIEIASKKFAALKEKKARGELDEYETASYWNQAHTRRVEENSVLSEAEVDWVCYTMLTASVDTTSGKLAWHLLHNAVNEEAQDKLHAEVKQIAEECEGIFDEDSFATSKAPYLHSFLRESHRLTNPANMVPVRTIAKDLEIHGVDFPAGTVFGFDAITKNNDPNLFDRVEDFVPERWFPDAVAARKGTRAEIIDNTLFSSPFGAGARRCPGSRVARNESMVMLSQLALDWKMSIPSAKTWRDVPYGLQTLTSPFLPKMKFVAR